MTPDTFDSFVRSFADAVLVGDWRIVTGLACITLVFGFRSLAGKLPGGVGDFFRSDRGGAVSALLVGVLGSLGHVLYATKDPINAKTFVDGVVMGVTAAGGYATVKKLNLWGLLMKLFSKAGAAVVLAGLMSLSGCAWLQAHPKVSAGLMCGAQGVALGMVDVVATALSGPKPDWQALGNLEKSRGVDVVICAVKQLMGGAGSFASVNPNVLKNGQLYLSKVTVTD